MNLKRFLLAALALFVFIFLYEWIVNGIFLTDVYKETPRVWRSPQEMSANFPLVIGFQLALALWLTFAFSQLYRDGGIANGLLFGLFFGVFAGLLTAYWYVWLPVSPKLGWSWFTSGLGEGLGGGLLLGSIYHR